MRLLSRNRPCLETQKIREFANNRLTRNVLILGDRWEDDPKSVLEETLMKQTFFVFALLVGGAFTLAPQTVFASAATADVYF